MKLPHARLIGKDYYKAYYCGQTIDMYRTSTGWVAFAGGIGALRHVGSSRAAALKLACEYVMAELD